MNEDEVTNVLMYLNIQEVLNLCKTDKRYHYICTQSRFWFQYFNEHHKIIAYQPTKLRDWILLYLYNDFVPMLNIINSNEFEKINKYYQIALNKVENKIEKVNNLGIENLEIDDYTIIFKTFKKSKLMNLIQKFKQIELNNYVDPIEIVFYPHDLNMGLFFSDGGFRLNDFIDFDSKDEMLVYLTLFYIESNGRDKPYNDSCILS